MCPLSGLCQFLFLISAFLLIGRSVFVKALQINFEPKNVTVYMYESVPVNYTITTDSGIEKCMVYSENPHVAYLENEIILNTSSKSGTFNITGNFLGQTIISCKDKNTNSSVSDSRIPVKCLRKKRLIDKIFTASVASLVAIIYINFGCVLRWQEIGKFLKLPIGISIGFFSQFIGMPVLSYVIGYFLFPDSPEMRLGMFFTGVAPGGGASNIWTAILDGNIELSIVMTAISTIAAFVMIPLWVFTLGRTIFKDADIEVPYFEILTYLVALIIPLAIGYLISRYCKRLSKFLEKILKGFSSILIMFIVVFAIIVNLYLFELFSWRIIVAGMGLPWLGYLTGYVLAKIFKQPEPDCLAIAIETGVQNTGIAIFLLRFALEPLQADLTTVDPVAVAIMTPFPLMLLYAYKKIKLRFFPNISTETVEDINDKTNSNNSGSPLILTVT